MMKKLIISLFVGLFFVGQAMALNFSVKLDSFTVASDTTAFAAAYPNITGGIKIDKIIFESTNTISTPVLITVYDTATSTTAATVDGYWVLAGTNTINGNNRIEVDYPYHNPLTYRNAGFFSSTPATTVSVLMTIIYR